jgi:hypothetical protein
VVASSRLDPFGCSTGVHCVKMLYEPKVLVANVRGLNDRARRAAVRSVVCSAGASIVCLQETKLSVVTHAIVMEALGADFDDYFCLPASDTRGDPCGMG